MRKNCGSKKRDGTQEREYCREDLLSTIDQTYEV